MITEDYVSFEIAKLLKEKGFDESISMVYMSYGDLCKLKRYNSIRNSNYNDITKNYFEYTAPTHQMVMKWLRKVYDIDISIIPLRSHKEYLPRVESDTISYDAIPCKKYEDACETAIKYCLKNLIYYVNN